MSTRAAKRPRNGTGLALMLVLSGVLAACAAPQRPSFGDPNLSMPAAQARLVPGQANKAEVLAALGPAAVALPFASGFEVWVYRQSPGGAELVLLFSPAGVLVKTRLRPADAAS